LTWLSNLCVSYHACNTLLAREELYDICGLFKNRETAFILNIIVMTLSKARGSFTERQRYILFSFYNQNPYPSTFERYLLAQLTGRTIKQVQNWFSNRRVCTLFLCLSHFISTSSLFIEKWSSIKLNCINKQYSFSSSHGKFFIVFAIFLDAHYYFRHAV